MSVDNDEIDPSFTPPINLVPSLGKGQGQLLLKTLEGRLLLRKQILDAFKVR